jgi:hypothetical protein
MSNVFASNAPDPRVATTTTENAKRSRGGHAAPDLASAKGHSPASLKVACDHVGGPVPKVAIGKTEGGKARSQISVQKIMPGKKAGGAVKPSKNPPSEKFGQGR